MNIIFDIGGTNFRYHIFDDSNNQLHIRNQPREDNVLEQLIDSLDKISIMYNIKYISVSIAGIINDNKIYGCMNAGLEDDTLLIDSYKNIKINYLNDGDAFILGEINNFNININGKNILGIIFGTGVGCGLIMNGKLIKNCEIHKYFEGYMKKNKLTNYNIIQVCKFISNELSRLIELLNLDYVIMNGYINKFDLFEEFVRSFLSHNLYYNPKIIVSKFKYSNIIGLLIN